VHSNTAIEFYRWEIDEGSIIESYLWEWEEGNDNEDIIVENKDSYLSINTLLDDERDVSQENEIIEYTVQPWDSISSIAYKFQVSNNSIYWANNFWKNSTINPGDIIKVPPVSGMIHRVKSWDTLAMIAKKYGVSEEKIQSQNNLDENNTLVKDSVIVIPGAIKKVEEVSDDTKLLAKNTKKTSSKTTKKTPKTNSFSKYAKSEYVADDWEYTISKKWWAKWFAWWNCTYYVAMHKKNVNWRGNANQWLRNAAAKWHATWSKASAGAIVVFNGRGYNPRYGHVGIVTSVKDDYIIVKDMNYRALNEVTVRKIPKDDRAIMWYIYVD
jgi:surface antigen